jgi:superfamily II DNA or RNA helicase
VEGVSDKSLAKNYSKQKSAVEFQKELTKELFETYIRPRIEFANRKIVELAKQTDIPVFIRKDLSGKTLHEELRIHIAPSSAGCLFNFIKDENGLRYFISLTNEGREISLLTKQGVIISDKPSVVLIQKEIYSVENIESKKLTPFFDKRYISVPARSEEIYLQNFVLKTMLMYEVRIHGIPVREKQPTQQAFLSLERDFDNELVLVPSFQYNDDPRIYPDNPMKKRAGMEDLNGSAAIWWYKRNTAWEAQLIDNLQEYGLSMRRANHFCLKQSDNRHQLIEWLNSNEERLLRDFRLEQRLERPFFTGTLTVQSDFEAKIDWFEINIKVLAGDYVLPFSCFRKHILDGNKEYVLPDGSIFVLPEEWFEKYQSILRYGENKGEKLRLKKFYTPILKHALNEDVSEPKRKLISDMLQIPATHPELPVQQATRLRPYQKEGFYWLEHLYQTGFGGCLADDMGLGKTLQTITLLKYVYAGSNPSATASEEPQKSQESFPATLVVAPKSLLHNWKNELTRFAPELRALIYVGDKRVKNKQLHDAFNPYQIIVTSYGTMRSDIEYFREYAFHIVILDESQYIKNPNSLLYKAVKQISSQHKLILTGTPLENSLEDLWAQFNFINEGLLGNLSSFRNDFIRQIKANAPQKEALLKKMISPFILRRTKEEVTPELPPLLQEVIYCDMTEEQETVYNTEKNRIRNLVIEAAENEDLSKNGFFMLEGLNRLRQLANHPQLVNPAYADDSGKLEQILLSFETLKASNHKVLIFSSYVKYLKLIAGKFDEAGWKYSMLTGETVKREKAIKQFVDNSDIHCFFISLKAGSTGLNLTAADYVFILDPWWNPASEMQAMSRAHRIGQDKNVIVYRFISTDTVEEKILHLQESKTALFETFINANNPLLQFNMTDIEQLLL